jgi:hypothetical protein
VIPSSNRSGYRYLRFVHVREGRRELYAGSVDDRSVRWVDLPPGTHRLDFVVSDAGKEVALHKEITLQPHQVLVAWCYTTYSLKPLRPSSAPEPLVHRGPGRHPGPAGRPMTTFGSWVRTVLLLPNIWLRSTTTAS